MFFGHHGADIFGWAFGCVLVDLLTAGFVSDKVPLMSGAITKSQYLSGLALSGAISLFCAMPLTLDPRDRLRTCISSTVFTIIAILASTVNEHGATKDDFAGRQSGGDTLAVVILAMIAKLFVFFLWFHRVMPSEDAERRAGLGLFAFDSKAGLQHNSPRHMAIADKRGPPFDLCVCMIMTRLCMGSHTAVAVFGVARRCRQTHAQTRGACL